MKDMIPKGTGNSRYLRSVSNFKSIYPTYDDFVNALVAGNLPVDFNGINEAGIQQVGTSLNKANLLTDEVARQVGLRTADPTPNDMFNVLANIGNLHVWERVQTYSEPVPEVPAGYTLGAVETNVHISSLTSGNVGIRYGDSVTVSNNGTVSISNSSDANNSVSDWGYSAQYGKLNGKFCTVYYENGSYVTKEVFFYPSGAYLRSDSNGLYATKLQRVTGYPYTPAIPAGTTTDYLTSTDRNAYTDGTVDSTTITYLGQLGGGARIEVGSYVGTGTYGKSNPNSLTFGFVPKYVRIIGEFDGDGTKNIFNEGIQNWNYGVVMEKVPTEFTSRTGFGDTGTYSKKSSDGKTLYWYDAGDEYSQYNVSNHRYYVLAIA